MGVAERERASEQEREREREHVELWNAVLCVQFV